MKIKLLLGLIIALGIALRFYHLNLSPGGLYADEASIGYNAYAILTAGKDEHGVAWPLFFRAFGEYKNPLFIYSLVPLIKVFGLSPWTVRAGAAVWGSLTLPLMYLFSYQLTKNKPLSLLATLILTLMPWHLHYSRLGFEAITLPALFLLALIFHFNKRPLLSGLVFGLSFYSYTTARLWAPLLMLILRPKVLAWIGFGLLLLPLLFWNRQYPGSLTARFHQISVFSDHPAPIVAGKRIITTYLAHWSPQFLFNRGDTTWRHSSGISSEMLIIWLPFFLAGLWLGRRQKLILSMIALFPLAASLTQTSPIATRTIQAAPFFALVIAYGAYHLKRPILIGLFLLLTGLEFGYYYRDLIYAYPARVRAPWHGFDSALGPAITEAYQQHLATGQPLYFSGKIEQAYIQSLFWTKTKFPAINTDNPLPAGLIVVTRSECDQPLDYCLLAR